MKRPEKVEMSIERRIMHGTMENGELLSGGARDCTLPRSYNSHSLIRNTNDNIDPGM